MNCFLKIALALFLPLFAFSQKDDSRFGIGFLVGLTATQIDGDDLQGYDKRGITTGIKSVAYITETINFSTNLLYTQKGSISKKQIQANYKKIDLAYAEVEFLFNVRDLYNPFRKMYRLEYSGGVSLGRLIRTRTVQRPQSPEIAIEEIERNFNTRDLTLVLGASYYVNDHFGGGLKFHRALTKLFDAKKNVPDNDDLKNLTSYYLSFNIFYLL